MNCIEDFMQTKSDKASQQQLIYLVSSDDDEDLKPAFSSESKASLSSQPKDSSSLKGKGKSPMHSQVTNVPSSSVSSSYSSYMEVIHDWDDDMDPDYLAAIEASLLDQTNGKNTFLKLNY